MGCSVHIEKINDFREGKTFSEIYFNLQEIPRLNLLDDNGCAQNISLISALSNGWLEKQDPTNPAIDALRALYNRERLLDWLKQGKPHRLVLNEQRNRFYYKLTDVVNYGQSAIGSKPHTPDLKIAAALAGIGIPVVEIRGSAGNHVFVLREESIGEGEKINTRELFKRIRERTLEEDHPFWWGFQALQNRERVLDIINQRQAKWLISRKGSVANAGSVIDPRKDKKELEKDLLIAQKHSGSF